MYYMKQFRYSMLLALALSGGRAQAQLQPQPQNLSLQDAVSLAMTSNPEIKASQLEIAKAKQQRVISKALLLPSVYATATANHYFKLPPFFGFQGINSDGKVTYGRFGGDDQIGAAIAAVQPLFNPLAYPTLHRSKLQEQESEIVLSGKQIEVISQVKQTYLQLLVLNERIKLQTESINRNQHALRDARSLMVQGKGLRVDTLRAYTSVKNLEPDLLKLSYAYQTGLLQLKALTGMNTLQQVALTDSLSLPGNSSLPAEPEVYEEAKKNNPEYQKLALQEKIDDQSIKVASSARKPVVSAVGQYQVQSQSNNFNYTNGFFPSNYYVGIQMSVPLFNGFSTVAKVKQAGISREQSGIRLNDSYEQLRARVHQAISDCDESFSRVKTTTQVNETAKLSYGIIQYRYAKGVASRLELTDAELSLTTAQSNYLEAVYDYLNARIALFRLMGKIE